VINFSGSIALGVFSWLHKFQSSTACASPNDLNDKLMALRKLEAQRLNDLNGLNTTLNLEPPLGLAKEPVPGILRFMFLSHQTIEKYIDEGKILIAPDFDKKNIRPVGIRIHLAKNLLLPEPNQVVSLTVAQDLKYQDIDLTREDFVLEPGQFVLGASYEAIQTPPNVLAILDGRSTVARLGLTVHITACVIDGTFETPHVAVLEIKNVGNFKIRLNFKDPVAMMLFAELKDPVTQKIQTQYGGGQSKATPPNLRFRTGDDK
jgi:dCTP deaminase